MNSTLRITAMMLLIIFMTVAPFFGCDTPDKGNADKSNIALLMLLLSGSGNSGMMVTVHGGTFNQYYVGSGFDHTISTFQIAKYEVTYELWYGVYQWARGHGYTFANYGTEGNLSSKATSSVPPTSRKKEPVTYVSWHDAMVWCNAYSEMSGLEPCYTHTASVIKDATNAAACNGAACDWSANGYRLPTEGEWMYAASYKNGTDWTPWDYASGATADTADSGATGLVSWYADNSNSLTHDAGSKKPNALGVYDMSGNVYEWCWDWCNDYPVASSTDYRGPGSGSERVYRSGSYISNAMGMQLGNRWSYPPLVFDKILGFRLARSL